MGTTQVKLYNKTLNDNRTMEIDNNDLLIITALQTDEDFYENQIRRKNIVTQVLGKYPTWSEKHMIYCTANCGKCIDITQNIITFINNNSYR